MIDKTMSATNIIDNTVNMFIKSQLIIKCYTEINRGFLI